MRTLSSGQTADQAQEHRRSTVRVWVANGSDTLTEQAAVRSCRIQASVEQKAVTATFVLQREDENGSYAPDIGTAIDARRRVQIDAVMLSSGETPGSGDYFPIFEGRVEDTSWGGDQSNLVVPCLDKWTELRRKWLLNEQTFGNDSSPVAIETVIQQVINSGFGSGVYTLNVIGTPTTVINEFTVPIQSMTDTIQGLLDVDGSDLRFQWSDADQAFVPTYFEPARGKTTPDHIFTNDDYFGVPSIAKVVSKVRTRVRVIWEESGSYVEAIDSTSEALYGEEALVLDFSKDAQITNSSLASSLAAKVLADVSMPAVEMVVDGRFFPWVELGDLYRFPANNVHTDSTIDLAVVGYTHEITPDRASTSLLLRGTPSGGVTRWFNRAKVAKTVTSLTPSLPTVPATKPTGTLSASFDTDGNLSAVIEGTSDAASWKIVGAIGAAPGDSTLNAATPIDGQSLDETDIGTLDTATSGGDLGYVVAIGFTEAAGGGTQTGGKLADVAMFGTSEAGIPDDSIGAAKIKAGVIGAAKQTRQSQSFSSTVRFGASSYTSVTWYSGDVKMADGTSVTVAAKAGGPLTLTGVTFLYFDGTTTLKSTTDPDDLADDDVVLLATCWPSVYTSAGAVIVPAVGALGVSGNLNLTGDNISANSIAATHIVAGTITANELAANSVTSGKISVLTLSAIAADVGTLTAGLLQNVAGTNYIDLDATGTDPFIKCGTDIIMRADGSATFGGTITSGATVEATSFTASNIDLSGDLTFATSKGLIGPNGQTWGATPDTGSGKFWVTPENISCAKLYATTGIWINSQAVSAGASDSGGTGYKLLRIPN